MTKFKLTKGDKVLIIAGKDRNKTGVIERVLPKKSKVVIAGINTVKKHLKKSAKNPQGGVIETYLPIHISNVMLLDPSKDKPTRIGINEAGDRVAKLTGNSIAETK